MLLFVEQKRFEDSDFDDTDRAPYVIRHPEPAYNEYQLAYVSHLCTFLHTFAPFHDLTVDGMYSDEYPLYVGADENDATYGAEDDPLRTRVGQPPNRNPRRPREEGYITSHTLSDRIALVLSWH